VSRSHDPKDDDTSNVPADALARIADLPGVQYAIARRRLERRYADIDAGRHHAARDGDILPEPNLWARGVEGPHIGATFTAACKAIGLEMPSETKERIRAEKLQTETAAREARGGWVQYLEGDAPGLSLKDQYWLAFGSNTFAVHTHETRILECAWDDVLSVQLSGSGYVSRNAGVVGGGFGLEGAAIGAAAAAVLNCVTTQTTLESLITVETVPWEAYFAFLHVPPSDVVPWLAPWRSRQRLLAAKGSHEPQDLVARLQALGDMRVSGLLSEAEFATAKSALLDT
jgi:hypothetical protein